MTPEDIGDIFQELEDNLFALAIRNIKRHENWEEAEGFKWTQWQAEQIAGLREYRKNVQVLTDYHFDKAKDAIKEYLKEAYDESVDDAENTARRLLGRFGLNGQMSQNFFGVNSNKLDIIINEAVQNVDTKRYAAINRMNSGYTDFLRRADMFAQSGSYTIPQAVDMASKDFLAAGLNSVEYSNGNRVNIASYAEMALRTSSAEVTRQANGDVRDEFGEYLVVSNVIGMTCPYCQKWQGKVLIDDVYSDGKPDGKHKLVSEAKADHFLHPNCRHQLFMYIEGITEVADLPNDVETKEHYKAEQKQRYYEREIRKYKRLRDGAVDPADRQKYDARVKEWTAKHDQFLKEHDYLRKNPKRLAPSFEGKANYVDELDKWTKNVNKNMPLTSNADGVVIDGIYHHVDGRDVKLDYSEDENAVGKLLSRATGKEVVMQPKVSGNLRNHKWPDYIINGERWDLKTLKEGKSKDLLRNIVRKKKMQANNFVFDITNSELSEGELFRQTAQLFYHYNTQNVRYAVLIKNGQLIKVFRRK